MAPPIYAVFAFIDLANNIADNAYMGSHALAESSGNLPVHPYPMVSSITSETHPTDLIGYGFPEFFNEVTVILLGKDMYDLLMLSNNGRWPYPAKRVVVLATTPLDRPSANVDAKDIQWQVDPTVEAFSDTVQDFQAKLVKEGLKKKWGRDLVWVLGGSALIDTIMEIKLIDRVDLVVLPCVFPAATPFWKGSRHGVLHKLELIESHATVDGAVCSSYSVAH
jgi:dihydrofolate reductase